MTTTNQLRRIEEPPAQLQAPAPVNFAEAVQAIIAAGVTADSAAAVQSLLASHHQEEERWARRTFLQAFKRVRDKTKTIQAEKAVPGSGGTVRWWYATLEDLQDAIEPICEAEGLMLNFDTPRTGDIVKGVCIVCHPDSGHEERRECSVDVKKAEGGDLGAAKKAKRGALTAMFGLKTRHMEENDPRILGEHIPPEDVEELESRCKALGNERYTKMLLKYLGAESFSDVYSSRLADARRALMQAEDKAKAKAKGTNPSPEGAVSPPRHTAPLQTPTKAGDAVVERDPALPTVPASPAQNTGPDAGARVHAPASVENPIGESGSVKAPAGRTFPGDSPSRKHEPSMGVLQAEGGGGGGVSPQGAPQGPQIASSPSSPDAWQHWRDFSPAETLSTWESMTKEQIENAWAHMPKAVQGIIKAKLIEARTK